MAAKFRRQDLDNNETLRCGRGYLTSFARSGYWCLVPIQVRGVICCNGSVCQVLYSYQVGTRTWYKLWFLLTVSSVVRFKIGMLLYVSNASGKPTHRSITMVKAMMWMWEVSSGSVSARQSTPITSANSPISVRT